MSTCIEVRSSSRNLATFAFAQLPGCCGVVVSYWSEVCADLRKKGLGALLLDVRMEAARRLNYGLITATVYNSNEAELAILRNQGWVLHREFRNPKTRNVLVLLSATL